MTGLRRIASEAAPHAATKPRRNRPRFDDRRRLRADARGELGHRRARERADALDRGVQRDAEAELIGRGRHRLAFELLRRANAESRRTRQKPIARSRRSRRIVVLAVGGIARDPRESEIEHAHAPVGPHHRVAGLEIAVNDLERVRRGQPRARLDVRADDLAPVASPPPPTRRACRRRRAPSRLRSGRRGRTRRAPSRRSDDRAGRALALPDQPALRSRRVAAPRMDDLERHAARQFRIARGVDQPHAAARDRLDDLVPADPRRRSCLASSRAPLGVSSRGGRSGRSLVERPHPSDIQLHGNRQRSAGQDLPT